jgi:Smg protein
MFDVLVYLYENYWRPDACPDHEQLWRKLSAVGFETDDIHEALSWLDGLTPAVPPLSEPSPMPPPLAAQAHSVRIYLPQEQIALGEECIGFIHFLEHSGVLTSTLRELVIDRALAAVGFEPGPLALDDLKIIILMVFWSMGQEPDSLVLDELFVAPEDRLIH